ncbi:MAG: NAD-dependent epimerase/dehydratase family protein [Bacteroidia bacterium]|nr:NAD-dependent epimerase/dehydratase family protein [Bacteroidia bacterium]
MSELRKIMVTGGAGNIGSELVRKLLQDEKNHVTVVDNLFTGSIDKLPDLNHPRFKFIKANVNYFEQIAPVFYSHNFDYVFHFAAVVGVLRTQQMPLKVLEDIDGIKNLLNLSTINTVKKFFFSSSSEVYGEPVEIPQHEHKTPLNSRIPYAVVKNVGECYIRSYHKEHNLNYTIFRFFNTYGPSQTTDFVIVKFLEAALKNKPITVYGDGSQTRTFTYIDDNIDTIIKILNEGLVENDVINIGNDEMISILDLAKLILRITGSKSEIVHLPPLKEGDMTRRQPDNSKMRSILQRPLISLEDGIKKMINDPVFLNRIGL